MVKRGKSDDQRRKATKGDVAPNGHVASRCPLSPPVACCRLSSLLVVAALVIAPALPAQSLVGTVATPITISDLDGQSVRLDAKAAGKPLLIEFWATWCEVCEALLPSVREAHRRFGAQVDFIGVNVTVNESRNRVSRWVEREKPPYRTLYDESGAAVRAFKAPVTSYVVVIDRQGVIRYTGVGADQQLVNVLEGVIEE
ncbi:MAG TPA: TlpA disulfide reductase family protein [Gemmatimonadales bacterium]|nr:TlpA disulfide reductase family protein [Gemmatimonadales bacterium]